MQDTRLLWALLALQAGCAAFFVFDSVLDALGLEDLAAFRATQIFEYLVSFLLVLGTALTYREIHRIRVRQRRLQDQLRIAAGAFEEVLSSRFETWGLTAAEQDVARLSLKGFSLAEIAGLRETAEGTVKSQSNAIYRKAGVTGRPQLLSLFIEDLMAEGLVAPQSDP